MAFGSWFGRARKALEVNRRRAGSDEVAAYFRDCAVRVMLRDLSDRGATAGDVFDMAAEWVRLSVHTTLRQSDFAAATGVLVKRLCLRHHGTGMFEFVLAENGEEALRRLRKNDWDGVEEIVGSTEELDTTTRAPAAPETSEVQLSLETDLARAFAEGFNGVSQAARVSWAVA